MYLFNKYINKNTNIKVKYKPGPIKNINSVLNKMIKEGLFESNNYKKRFSNIYDFIRGTLIIDIKDTLNYIKLFFYLTDIYNNNNNDNVITSQYKSATNLLNNINYNNFGLFKIKCYY